MRLRTALSVPAALALVAGGIVLGSPTAGAATAPPGFGYGTPSFVNSPAPSYDGSSFYFADNAGEPSLGLNWQSGHGMFMAGTDTYRLTFDNSTQPAGVTWADRSSPYSLFNLDPILATDPKTGTTIAGGDNGACAVMSITTNDGGSQSFDNSAWTPSAPCPFAADHPTVGMGPYAGTPLPNATAPFVTYFCQQLPFDGCSHSVDGGLTWSPSVPDPLMTCQSLFGHVKVSADGTAYIPSANCSDASGNSVVGAITSSDNGTTLSGFGIPGAPTPADGFDPSIATDANNRVYESWSRAGDYHPVVAWSDDHGATWSGQKELGTDLPQPLVAATFQAAVAGDSGRAAVAYLGTYTGQPGQDPFTAGFHGIWYLFVSSTDDGGATWHTVQVTPDPVQRGEIDAGGTTTSGQRNLLDFMDASLTKDGRIVVAYADGCTGSCDGPSGTEAESTGAHATVAYQTAGQGLFSQYDVTPLTAPSAPTLAVSGAETPTLSWSAPADGGSPITSYSIQRSTAAGAETEIASVPADQLSFTDSSAALGQTYYYVVSAVNAVGTGDRSNEVSASPHTTTTTPGAPVLSARAGKGQVALSWTTPSDGGAPITSWSIYRGTSAGSETLLQTITNGTSYVDGNVTGGTTYFYEVAATNSNGTGARSNEASATPKGGGGGGKGH